MITCVSMRDCLEIFICLAVNAPQDKKGWRELFSYFHLQSSMSFGKKQEIL